MNLFVINVRLIRTSLTLLEVFLFTLLVRSIFGATRKDSYRLAAIFDRFGSL